MNLPSTMADWLRSAGHDAVHVRELGLSDAPDREIIRAGGSELPHRRDL